MFQYCNMESLSTNKIVTSAWKWIANVNSAVPSIKERYSSKINRHLFFLLLLFCFCFFLFVSLFVFSLQYEKDYSVPLKKLEGGGRCAEYLQPNLRPGGRGIELHSEIFPNGELPNVNKITMNKPGCTGKQRKNESQLHSCGISDKFI